MRLLVKNLLFTILVPGTVAGVLPHVIARDRSASSGPLLVIGVVALVLGAAIYGWCVWDFASFGRGTPAPIDAPRKLVVRGLYGYTRNPMYLGVLTVILGWAALFASVDLVVYAFVVGGFFHLFVVLYEERALARAFGGQYEAYCALTPRWLPRPRR